MIEARLNVFAACAAMALLLATSDLCADQSGKAEKLVKEFLADKNVIIPATPISDEAL
jgi:hypothetical protein